MLRGAGLVLVTSLALVGCGDAASDVAAPPGVVDGLDCQGGEVLGTGVGDAPDVDPLSRDQELLEAQVTSDRAVMRWLTDRYGTSAGIGVNKDEAGRTTLEVGGRRVAAFRTEGTGDTAVVAAYSLCAAQDVLWRTVPTSPACKDGASTMSADFPGGPTTAVLTRESAEQAVHRWLAGYPAAPSDPQVTVVLESEQAARATIAQGGPVVATVDLRPVADRIEVTSATVCDEAGWS